jgi:hypothetical protein
MQMRMICNWISACCLRRIAQSAANRQAVTFEGGKATRVEPMPAGAPTQQEAKARRVAVAVVGAAWVLRICFRPFNVTSN